MSLSLSLLLSRLPPFLSLVCSLRVPPSILSLSLPLSLPVSSALYECHPLFSLSLSLSLSRERYPALSQGGAASTIAEAPLRHAPDEMMAIYGDMQIWRYMVKLLPYHNPLIHPTPLPPRTRVHKHKTQSLPTHTPPPHVHKITPTKPFPKTPTYKHPPLTSHTPPNSVSTRTRTSTNVDT